MTLPFLIRQTHVFHSTLVVDHPHCMHDHLSTACHKKKGTSTRTCQERLGAEAHRSQVSWTARTDGCQPQTELSVEGLSVDCPKQSVGISKECRGTCDRRACQRLRLINRKIMKRKENSQGMGRKNPSRKQPETGTQEPKKKTARDRDLKDP